MNAQITNRLGWVDIAKGICIVLVVLMHATHGVEKAIGQPTLIDPFIEWARPFRLPDFFLISGLFLAARINKPWRTFLDGKVLHFAYFYLLWTHILIALKAPGLIGDSGVAGLFDLYASIVWRPFGPLWFLYLLGYNAQECALVKESHSEAEFYAAYKIMTDKLRPWTIDFHVAQNDGHVHGAGAHDKTGKHCPADDPNGKLDIVKCAGYWLQGATERGIKHICWDGCMFPNAMLENPSTWNTILAAMIKVRDAHGWS